MQLATRLTIFLFSFLPVTALAWTPCMPFCDSTCGAPAIISMGSSIQAAFAQQQAQLQTLGNEIASVNNNFVSFGQNYVDDYTNDTFDRLSALDAATSKLETGWAQQIKAEENLSDFKLAQWKVAVEKYFNASQSAHTARIAGDAAQSQTGDLGACSAGEIKQAHYRTQQISESSLDVHRRYLEDIQSGDSALSTALKNESAFSDTSPIAMLHDSSIPDDVLQNLQGLLSYLVTPLSEPTTSGDGVSSSEKDELEQLGSRMASAWIAGIAAETLSSRAIYGDLECETSYVSSSGSNAGNSLNELLRSKIEGRLTAEGYWGVSKMLLNAGLRRELVYLKAEENMLLYQRYKVRSRRNELLSFIVARRSLNM